MIALEGKPFFLNGISCYIKNYFHFTLLFCLLQLVRAKIRRFLPHLNQFHLVWISQFCPKKPLLFQVIFCILGSSLLLRQRRFWVNFNLHCWGIKCCKRCVILRYYIPVYNLFVSCWKLTFNTNIPLILIIIKLQIWNLHLVYCDGCISMLFQG